MELDLKPDNSPQVKHARATLVKIDKAIKKTSRVKVEKALEKTVENSHSELFSKLLKSHPAIKIATSQDTVSIAQFLDSVPMEVGAININVSRGQDFFALLKKQGHSFLCFLVMENQEISGLSCVVFRRTYIRGKLEEVGYLQDLRLKPTLSGKLRQEFFSFYSEALRLAHLMPETQYCRYFYSAVLKGNETAKKVLSRSGFPLKYVHFASYKAFLFPKPSYPAWADVLAKGLAKKAQKFVSVSTPATNFKNVLKDFFNENSEHSFFAPTWDDVERCLPHSEVVTVQENGQLMGVCLLASSKSLRSYDVALPKVKLHAQFNGVYPFALTVRKTSKLQQHLKWKNALLQKAFLCAHLKEAAFFGMMVADVNRDLPLFLRILPKVCVEGALYRVFHPEHLELQPESKDSKSSEHKDFMNGFLRPSDVVSLEMSLL